MNHEVLPQDGASEIPTAVTENNLNSHGRRSFIKGSLALIPTVALGTSTLSFADAAKGAVDLDTYKPVFFNADEWKFILAACDRLIPAEGEGPGALESNVPVFIDLQLAGDFGKAADWYMEPPFHEDVSPLFGYQLKLTPAEVYRQAIAQVDIYAKKELGGIFADLKAEQQDQLLTSLQKGEIELDGVPAKQFFDFLLQNTKEGYFADPIYGGNKGMKAWSMIGFPGARAGYLEWVDQLDKPYPLGPVSINGDRG